MGHRNVHMGCNNVHMGCRNVHMGCKNVLVFAVIASGCERAVILLAVNVCTVCKDNMPSADKT